MMQLGFRERLLFESLLPPDPAINGRLPNMLGNPSFESADTSMWVRGTAVSLALVTTDSKYGAQCGQINVTAGGGIAQLYQTIAIAGNTAGRFVKVSLWFKGTASSIGSIRRIVLREQGGLQAQGTITSVDITLTANWQLMQLQGFLVQPDRTQLSVDTYSPNAPALGYSVLIDDGFCYIAKA